MKYESLTHHIEKFKNSTIQHSTLPISKIQQLFYSFHGIFQQDAVDRVLLSEGSTHFQDVRGSIVPTDGS